MRAFSTANPFNGDTLKTYAVDDLKSINDKVACSHQVFARWRKVPVDRRVEILSEALQYFERHREMIAGEITAQMGKPLRQSRLEVDGFFERARHLLSIAEETLKPEILPAKEGMHRRIEQVPLGCVFILAAWNYPLMIAVNGVLPALLAGNTVVLKHAAATLSIGEHFEKAFGSIADFEGLVRHVVADHDTVGKVIRESAIDHVVFTGSVEGGHAVHRHASTRLIDCHLELGGKDGVYVAADADPIKAAEGIVDGAMYNAGQSCCGIERAYVHEAVYEDFIGKATELASSYHLGDPLDDECDMGPLFNARAADPMETQIEQALHDGAQVICGGRRKVIQGATYFEPTLITEVTQQMRIMQEENFGPILPVLKVGSDEKAIAMINDSDYGLTAAIFTNDDELAEHFAVEVNTGTVFRNRCDYLDPALPWTGVKESGKGSSLSRYGFYGLTRRKAINFRQQL